MAALVALGVGPGTEVLVPGYTYVASISAILIIGGIPVLTEIDESLIMDPRDVADKITERTKVIMPVHMLGNATDMASVMKIAENRGMLVLEDCCQSLGARYRGRYLGSIGHVGAFSLNINKTITSGDGGVVTTNNTGLYERAFGFHDQGHIPLRMGVEIGKRSLIGMNLRMNELTGAVALGQLSKLDAIITTLRDKKSRFKRAVEEARLPGLYFRTLNDPEECATLLTVLFEDSGACAEVAKALGVSRVSESGWHVYNNMEHILALTDSQGSPRYRKHMLPRTDDILNRAINLSVGVVDPGLGAGFGINVLATDAEIDRIAKTFVDTVRRCLS
jgi:dTDP-4-amino-4,6-dideoxygalactose transaminase